MAARVRRENETAEERNRRRAEKVQRVSVHRAQILQKVNARAKPQVREDFICPVEFDNSLPDLPVDAVFLEYPFDDDVLTAYDVLHGVSTEAERAHQLHVELDLGVRLALVDPNAFTAPADGTLPPLDPADEYITRAEFAKPVARAGRGAAIAPSAAGDARGGAGGAGAVDSGKVEWMMQPQHMHLDLHDAVYKHADVAAAEGLAAARARAALDARFTGSRRDRIIAGFAAVAPTVQLVHPLNPRLQPVRVWEVLPDPHRTAASYVHVTFDGDPDDGAAGVPPPVKRARASHAVIRTPAEQPVNVREGSVVVNYLLPVPSDVTVAPAGSPADSTSSDGAATRMQPVRDYHMVVQRVGVDAGTNTAAGAASSVGGPSAAAAAAEDHIVLFWDDANATITFAPLRARATLTSVKLRGRSAGGGAEDVPAAPLVLVRRRPLPEEEDAVEEARARLDEADPAPRLRAVAARRRARHAVAAAAAAGSDPARGEASLASRRETRPPPVPAPAAAFREPTEDLGDFAVVEEDEDSS